ncbi:MAG: diaminopimelate decarboxylase [Myxococcota bacterium]
MDHFRRRDGQLHCEDVPLRDIAEAVGTPTYVYSRATLERHFKVFDAAWEEARDHLVCFAVKACSNLAILDLLARLGSGFDIVSGGELHRVLRAGGDPGKVVFSGVGKKEEEITAALEAGILCFNVESEAELEMIDRVARRTGRKAPVSMRVNPDVDAGTHPYIATGLRTSKFGIPHARARAAYRRAAALDGLEVVGVDCHIGSQLKELGPMVEALRRLLELIDDLADEGIAIEHLDLGGGLGITYEDEAPPSPAEYADRLLEELGDRELRIILEPGRVIAGNAGVLLMQVLLEKDNDGKRFVVVDAAMNDAIRPALYDAYHRIEPVGPQSGGTETVDVVGPVCESGDFFARDRALPRAAAGDLLAMRSVGAYGFVMASNYNSRPRPAEVLVDRDRFHVVRRRESLDDLCSFETIPPS